MHIRLRLGLLLLILMNKVSSRVLFFGVTHSGKSTLINLSCGLDLKVAEKNQVTSTTKMLSNHVCLGNKVIDSVGVFDYDKESNKRIDVFDVLKMILENAANEGLSGVIWVWSTKQTVGNHELEAIFTKLQSLLPEILPMAIVENQFGDLQSEVPNFLSNKYGLPLIKANLNNVEELKKWIRLNNENIQVKLPPDWENLLVEHDINQLRSKLLDASLLSCDTVRTQLSIISEKIKNTPHPAEQCSCGQDCRRNEEYCCSRIFGFCISHCEKRWIDENCQKAVTLCYETCKKAHGEQVAQINELLNNLNIEFNHITTDNQPLLKACDKFKLADKKQQQEL